MSDIGDFAVSDFALDFARDKQSQRDARARGVDAERRAPVTTDVQKWAENPDDFDFPGIDTPSESPSVMPKDLRQQEKPSTTARASRDSPTFPDDPDIERTALANQDVSLGPEEAFDGVAATSSRAAGGFDNTRGGEVRPVDETGGVFE